MVSIRLDLTHLVPGCMITASTYQLDSFPVADYHTAVQVYWKESKQSPGSQQYPPFARHYCLAKNTAHTSLKSQFQPHCMCLVWGPHSSQLAYCTAKSVLGPVIIINKCVQYLGGCKIHSCAYHCIRLVLK